MGTRDILAVFKYLDEGGDDYLDYNEFCLLYEEKRKGLDPFDKMYSKRAQEFYRSARLEGDTKVSRIVNPEEEWETSIKKGIPQIDNLEEGKFTVENDAMMMSYQQHRQYLKRQLQRNQQVKGSYGLKLR